MVGHGLMICVNAIEKKIRIEERIKILFGQRLVDTPPTRVELAVLLLQKDTDALLATQMNAIL